MTKKVTLADVAREAGVSIATVDRVVNKRGGVEAAKEERVLHAAKLLGLDRRLAFSHVKIKRVAVMLQPPANPFHAELRSGVEMSRNVFNSLSIHMHIMHIAPQDHAAAAQKILALQGQVDGLIITASDVPEIASALRWVGSSLPVVTLAHDITDCGRLAYVGPDDARSGRVAGDLLGRFLGERGGRVLVVAGSFDILGHRARSRGFTDMLSAWYPQCEVAQVIETGEAGDVASARVHDALKADPSIRGIYHLSVGASGVVRAVEAQQRSDEIFVVAHELTSNRRKLLRSRSIHAVLDQNPHLEARLATEIMAARLGRLEGAVDSVETDVQIYMAENA